MFWLYRFLFLPALFVLAPRYLWRMRRRGGYRQNFAHRFGAGHRLPPRREGVRRIWLQAVSVGEVLAIAPLLEALKRDPHIEVYLTTTTSTGYRLADDRYRGLVLGIGYFPMDWWLFSRRAWRAIAPDLVVLTEGERWPEHIHQAKVHHVPVICINARLSDRSYARLRRLRIGRHLMLDGIERLLPCSAADAARFQELGFPPERMVITGNIKLDVEIPPLHESERQQLRRELGLGAGPVLLGSSTWPGEERALVEAWRTAHAGGWPCALLLVPRHAERRVELEHLMAELGVTFHLRSRGPAPQLVDVAIADTTGELRKLTQLSDLVFIGKSLPPNDGGQTPVEAAALRKPMLFGPQMSNFRTIAAELAQHGAAIVVPDGAALTATVLALLGNSGRAVGMAQAAERWQRANAGAGARTLAVLHEELGKLNARAGR